MVITLIPNPGKFSSGLLGNLVTFKKLALKPRFDAGVSLEAGYQRSTIAYVTSHRQLLNLTFKRVVIVISSTEMGRNNYESLYFIL